MSIYDLPDIQLVDADPEKTTNELITVYEAVSGVKLYPGDPVRLFLLSIADIIIHQRVLINHAAKQNLLRYAEGNMLDHIGAMTMTPRLDATAAIATVRFYLSAARPGPVLIPAGTRTTPGNEIYFMTASAAEIPAGELFVDIPVVCLTTGTIGNNYLTGQINVLVDPIPFVSQVENITESSGGSDVEDDESYRERIYMSPEHFSVAGPEGSYEFWARTANPNISDVKVSSPNPVEVEIRVLMSGGEIPSKDILDAVDEVCNDRTIRPLTDKVTVLAPTEVNYDIDIQYWIDSSRSAEASQIQTAVQSAVDDYVLWQKSRIGRDIMPSELIRLVMNAGARRVEIISPTHTLVADTEIAVADTVTVDYGGLEDD